MKLMAIVYLLSWWYNSGFKQLLLRSARRVTNVFDYFSIDILLKTLFSPFRQISGGRVRGGIDIQFRAFLDRLISRLIGAAVRSMTILVGLVTLTLTILVQMIIIVLWIVVPFLPFIGLVLMLGSWVPWSL